MSRCMPYRFMHAWCFISFLLLIHYAPLYAELSHVASSKWPLVYIYLFNPLWRVDVFLFFLQCQSRDIFLYLHHVNDITKEEYLSLEYCGKLATQLTLTVITLNISSSTPFYCSLTYVY